LVLGFREIRQETTLDAQGEAQQAGKQALGNSKKNSFNRFTQFKLFNRSAPFIIIGIGPFQTFQMFKRFAPFKSFNRYASLRTRVQLAHCFLF
jgi:hypothetical protein